MKYKGLKEACSATKELDKYGRSMQVCIYRFGDQVKYHSDLTRGSWIKFEKWNQPDAMFYARSPMTMKEIEKALDGGEENGKI